MAQNPSQNLKPPKTGIFVEYYKSHLGPTIIIDTMTLEELNQIRDVFMRLAQGRLDVINLLSTAGITPIGINALILRRLHCDDRREKGFEVRKIKAEEMNFIWSLPPVGWWGLVNLVDGLLDGRGHHYLTNGDIDDAIVVLQYMESAAYRGIGK